MESEREAAIFCKRGQKKEMLLKKQNSPDLSQGKQSLVDAREPSSDIISQASFIRSQELMNEKMKNVGHVGYSGQEIVNVCTHDDSNFFGKLISSSRNTFLNEQEEEDLMNVNEFEDNDDMCGIKTIHIGPLISNGRVLKKLPITKESFINWHKQSLLKSFATSHEASFVSNKQTERIENSCVIDPPREPIKLEQNYVEIERINQNSKEINCSPGGNSTQFIDEASAYFEEFEPSSVIKEKEKSWGIGNPTPTKSKYQMRMDNLHNCNKVHDYKIKVCNISKESVPISRNKGDINFINKDSADFIEQEIIGEDYESSRDYPNVIQSKRFNKEHEIKNLVTHNQLSDFLEDADSKIVMTPGSNGFESVGKQRIQKNRFEESKEYEKKNLSSLVTKVDPFCNPINRRYEKDASYNNSPLNYEQGQNTSDDDYNFNKTPIQDTSLKVHYTGKFDTDSDAHHKILNRTCSHDEKIIEKYVEKERSNSRKSRSEHSITHSSGIQDSPALESNNEEEHQTELHKAHLIQTLQAIQYINTLSCDHSLEGKYVNLPPHPLFRTPDQTKTIIFDLDETLVHCVDDPETDSPHVILKVTFPTGETVDAGINIRPYAIECLKEANKYFQVVVFTASHQSYADVVLDYIDPNHDLIHYRLYRESCILTKEGVYIKDLRIFKNRKIENVVIVDNAVYSFGFQLDNGIPIIPFYDDPNDEELHHLVFYMKCLSSLEDMRIQNQNAFQLASLDSAFIEKYLNEYYAKLKEENEEGDENENQDD